MQTALVFAGDGLVLMTLKGNQPPLTATKCDSIVGAVDDVPFKCGKRAVVGGGIVLDVM